MFARISVILISLFFLLSDRVSFLLSLESLTIGAFRVVVVSHVHRDCVQCFINFFSHLYYFGASEDSFTPFYSISSINNTSFPLFIYCRWCSWFVEHILCCVGWYIWSSFPFHILMWIQGHSPCPIWVCLEWTGSTLFFLQARLVFRFIDSHFTLCSTYNFKMFLWKIWTSSRVLLWL